MPAPLYVVYASVPSLDPAAIAKRLGAPAKVTPAADGKSFSIFHGGQPIEAFVSAEPAPAADMERCLRVAHLKPELKAALAGHKAHVALVHRSDIPGMQGLVALYQVAAALGGEAIGVVNPISCMAIPKAALDQTVAPDFLASAKTEPGATLGLWLGFVRLVKPDGNVWVFTTGASLIGLPNLAKLAPSRKDADDVYALLASLQNYLYAGLGQGKKTILVGDTIDVGNDHLVARTPYEFVDEMGERTLVLERRATPAAL